MQRDTTKEIKEIPSGKYRRISMIPKTIMLKDSLQQH